MIKAFASDLDGTLLNDAGEISEFTARAIKKVQKRGVLWITVTGRSQTTAFPILQKAGISGDFILLNGAEFRSSSGDLILNEEIPPDKVMQIVNHLEREGLSYELNTSTGDFSTDTEFCASAEKMRPVTELISRKCRFRKIFVFSQSMRGLDNLRKLLSYDNEIFVTSSSQLNIEITSRNATKGKMLEKVCSYYGIYDNEIMVFGNGENDMTMFEYFPISCAVCSGERKILAAAKRVVESNNDNGVGKEIERMLCKLK